jgi:hypothetical protein
MRHLHERGLVSRYADGSEFFDGIAVNLELKSQRAVHHLNHLCALAITVVDKAWG